MGGYWKPERLIETSRIAALSRTARLLRFFGRLVAQTSRQAMTKTSSAFTACAIILGALIYAGAAEATQVIPGAGSGGPAQVPSNHTWVSHTGVDGGACTATSPCRSLLGAYTNTAANGEIDIVDAGDYGGLEVSKGITIVNDGAGVASVGFIYVQAAPTDDVILRGLTFNGIDGASSGANGPQLPLARRLSSAIIHQLDWGRFCGTPATSPSSWWSTACFRPMAPTAMGPSISRLWLEAACRRDRAGSVFDAPGNGVRVDSTNGAAQVELRDVSVSGSAGGSGIVAVSPTSGGAPAAIYADNVAATGNACGYGLRAVGGTAAIYLNRSTIMNNAIIGASSAGAVVSYSNNSFAGNGTDGSPTSVIGLR